MTADLMALPTAYGGAEPGHVRSGDASGAALADVTSARLSHVAKAGTSGLFDPALAPSTHFIVHDNEIADYIASGSGVCCDESEPDTVVDAAMGIGGSTGGNHSCSTLDDGRTIYFILDGLDQLVPVAPADVRPPVRLAANSADQCHAALFTAALWNCVERAGGPHHARDTFAIFPGAFTADWLSALYLPTREQVPDGQAVALADHVFTRHGGRAQLLADYHARPRTWVFERVNESVPWLNLAVSYLTRLSASPFPVIAAVYDSRAADRPSAAHRDQWYSVIVQVQGMKLWTIGPDQDQVVTTPGDVLLVPEGLSHAVATPADPGLSRHLVFNVAMHTVYTRA